MTHNLPEIFIGDTSQQQTEKSVRGDYVTLLGEPFLRIENFDAMDPFLMTIVSSSDHWLFIASTGGLSLGRGHADHAFFPYYTVDKLTENSENTGNKAILLVTRAGRTSLWEPFSDRQWGSYSLQRNLYKNVTGTAVVFEENNIDLGLTYQYAWRTSEKFGFIKTTWLKNLTELPCQVGLVDGLQNILPANVSAATQNTLSSLLDAYKRSELVPEVGLGIFALNSRLTDLAEPSESLLASTVAQIGLGHVDHLLSSAQLDRFRSGKKLTPEAEIRGQRGAYFVYTTLDLSPSESRTWHLIADVDQDSAAIADKIKWLEGDQNALQQELEDDITANQFRLWQIVASADGVQLSNSALYSAHHFSNVMFNVMRGGIFADQYWVSKDQFIDFVTVRNPDVLKTNAAFFTSLPDRMQIAELQAMAESHGSTDMVRLSYAYLPLTFSRRHGDPSRPWNRFTINVKQPDGTIKLDYEGNWRDIFQNWEALACSYPEFVESMIATFLNATTADGYNPYRITYNGVDWEVPEPDNPWANIGYWSDHQIVYLQRLMELSAQFHPGRLHGFLARRMFSYANVPYRIKPYAELLKDPYNTIDFDLELEQQIEAQQNVRGADGKLVYAPNGQILHVSLAEKILTLLLAKLVNLVPEGGIWMNTQRPEWNDANNALVGKGLSVVTLGYLRRYIAFCRDVFSSSGLNDVPVSAEVQTFYAQVLAILNRFQPILHGSFKDEQRRSIMDALGQTGSDYRSTLYHKGLSGEFVSASVTEIIAFLDLAQAYVEHALRANRRSDHLYHTYNILHLDHGRASVSHLYEMLEGQVSILSSGMLSSEESVKLLHSLRSSALYLPEQHSYILYPDRNLPGFLKKNCITHDQVSGIRLIELLLEARDTSIMTRDLNGVYHFSGHIRNFNDVRRALDALRKQPRYADLVAAETEPIRALFEATFHHDEFTGRSGTFFAYEGLGSIYWHMVAKLLLAVQEVAIKFRQDPSAEALLACYADVREGLSFNKTPDVYGAFPTDAYSHTPKGQGAKQPGMTGLVKEMILTRQAEMGVRIVDGRLTFDTTLLDRDEYLAEPAVFRYVDTRMCVEEIALKAGSLAYSICQTPIVIQASDSPCIQVHYADGSVHTIEGSIVDEVITGHIFRRNGKVRQLHVSVPLDR